MPDFGISEDFVDACVRRCSFLKAEVDVFVAPTVRIIFICAAHWVDQRGFGYFGAFLTGYVHIRMFYASAHIVVVDECVSSVRLS